MRKNAALYALLAIILVKATSALANAPSDTEIRHYLEAANPGDVLDSYKPIYSGPIGELKDDATIATYNLCVGGGNFCGFTFGVFINRNGTVFMLPNKPELNGQLHDISVTAGRIIVHSNSFAPSDPHCCPSVPHKAIYEVHQDFVKLVNH